MRMRQNTTFSEYPRFFCFLKEKSLKSAPAAKGGGGATKFSAEMMVNRATWQSVECIVFRIRNNRNSVAPLRLFRFVLHETQ